MVFMETFFDSPISDHAIFVGGFGTLLSLDKVLVKNTAVEFAFFLINKSWCSTASCLSLT